jgi:D-methionine transport system ATP-binding protein
MIELSQVEKTFQGVIAVHPLSLTITKGQIHGIVGTSGAGKSTLIRMMNLLEKPDKGEVRFGEKILTNLSEQELRKARQNIGMIFQQFQLVLNRTVAGNVSMPLELVGIKKKERVKRVEECLQFVGLSDKKDAYPSQLSGGQKQRVAIALALENKPTVLLCD